MSQKSSKILRKFAKEMGKQEKAVKVWYGRMNTPDKAKAMYDMKKYINAK